MIALLANYFQYPFVRYAFVVGVLVALCASLLGVTLVLKRFSLIGDGLSHVAFGAMAVGAVMKMNSTTPLTLIATVACAVLLLQGGRRRVNGDAAVAMLSVSALGMGYLLMNVFARSANLSGDVCSILFGSFSILTLDPLEVRLCAVLSFVVITVFVLFYHRIFAVTFDEEFAAATGTRARLYNLVIAVTVAVIIALGMNLVGSLLISALIVFPALSAMRLFKSFLAVTICSAVVSVLCAAAGLVVSVLGGTPVGSTIVAGNILVFLICAALGRLKGAAR